MFIFKILSYITIYIIKQKLIKEKINIKKIIYALILIIYTKPTLENAITRSDLLIDFNIYMDLIITTILFL